MAKPKAKTKRARFNREQRALLRAALYGEVAAVRARLAVYTREHLSEALVQTCGRHHTIAFSPGHLQTMRLLLEHGADPNSRGGWAFERPITAAAAGGFADAVALLRDFGAEVDLFAMAAIGDADSVAAQLRALPRSATTLDDAGLTALHHCANSRLGRTDSDVARRLEQIAMRLIDCGAEVDALCAPPTRQRIRPRISPLVYACIAGNAEVATALLRRGAQPNLRCSWGTPLMQACKYSPRIGEVLLEHGARVDEPVSDDGRTALHIMAHFPHPAAVQWLLEHGASATATTHDGRTPLHFAASRNSSANVARMLVAAGADPRARDRTGQTPLDYAIAKKKQKVIAYLNACLRID